MTDLTAVAVATIPCPYCQQPAGARCRTRSGRRSGNTHADRTAPVFLAWRVGWAEGTSDAVGTIRRQLDQREHPGAHVDPADLRTHLNRLDGWAASAAEAVDRDTPALP